jgi:RecA/RadA recombinase
MKKSRKEREDESEVSRRAEAIETALSKMGSAVLSKRLAVSTGSTLLNLACSGRYDVGFVSGCYYFIVGDSTSGKTWISLSCFAEAARRKEFDNYRLIYDNVEDGVLFDVGAYFGRKVAERMEPPSVDEDGQPVYSTTVESFYAHLMDALDKKQPFIYVLDSQDALDSIAARDRFEDNRKALKLGKDLAASYGDGKAKYHSEHIRTVLSGIRDTGSILIIIGQTRDNLGFGFEKRVRSGGRALRFYAQLEIWTSVAEKIKRQVRGKQRTIGIKCLAEVKKNRLTGRVGKDRAVLIPIFYGYGIDDVGSVVEFLVNEGCWKKHRGVIQAPEFDFEGNEEELIQKIQQRNLYKKLFDTVQSLWDELEEACRIQRIPRYE